MTNYCHFVARTRKNKRQIKTASDAHNIPRGLEKEKKDPARNGRQLTPYL